MIQLALRDSKRARGSACRALLAMAMTLWFARAAVAEPAPSATEATAPGAPAPAPSPSEPTAPATPEAEPAPATANPEPAPAAAPKLEVQATSTPATAPASTTDADEACDEHKRPEAEGFGAFLLGLGLFDFDDLSDTLQAAGYERLDDVGTIIGGEGHAILKSGFVIGGRGAALLYGTVSGPDSFDGEVSGGFGMADFGFAPVHTRTLLFSATAGVGGYGLSLDLQEGTRATFDEVLDDPRRSASLSTGGILLAVTLALDARIPLPRDESEPGEGYFAIGVRVGGLYGPQLSEWSGSDGEEVARGPSGALRGGYAAVTIGFGGGAVPGSE